MPNIFHLPSPLPPEEYFEPLAAGNNLRIERIISNGQTTPIDEWYDQDQDEWVILLQGSATIAYEDSSTLHLRSGDYVFIPAHQRHQVVFTSADPPCIWLAVHGNLSHPVQ